MDFVILVMAKQIPQSWLKNSRENPADLVEKLLPYWRQGRNLIIFMMLKYSLCFFSRIHPLWRSSSYTLRLKGRLSKDIKSAKAYIVSEEKLWASGKVKFKMESEVDE